VIDATVENGLREFWDLLTMLPYTDKSDKTEPYETVEITYPLIIHAFGLLLSLVAFVYEIMLYFRRNTQVLFFKDKENMYYVR
jgi:hypothetical protein